MSGPKVTRTRRNALLSLSLVDSGFSQFQTLNARSPHRAWHRDNEWLASPGPLRFQQIAIQTAAQDGRIGLCRICELVTGGRIDREWPERAILELRLELVEYPCAIDG